MTCAELILDRESFPKSIISAVPFSEIDRYRFAKFVDKSEQKYIEEYGERVNYMEELIISAERKKPEGITAFYDTPVTPVTTFTANNIDRQRPLLAIFSNLCRLVTRNRLNFMRPNMIPLNQEIIQNPTCAPLFTGNL